MFRLSLVLVSGLWLAQVASAATWAESMFAELSNDFGSVPRGPAATHQFTLTNNTGAPVHIAGVRVSCGCTTAAPAQTDLKPGQSTVINASMDTRRFSGHKSVTIYVTFTQPQYAEVALLVTANGRDDVSMTPETLAFGRVSRGAAPTAETTVVLSGYTPWHVREASCESSYVKLVVQETVAGGSSYLVKATLRPDTPVGNWYTDVWLKTDSAEIPRLRIPVTVTVESGITLSPATVSVGEIKMGSDTQRKVILRGVKPFSITAISGDKDQVVVTDAAKEKSQVHVLTVAIKPKAAGEHQWTVRIATDLEGEAPVQLRTEARVMP